VIVIDNASYDGGVDLLKKYFPKVKIIANNTNIGFTRANNQPIRIPKVNSSAFSIPTLFLYRKAKRSPADTLLFGKVTILLDITFPQMYIL